MFMKTDRDRQRQTETDLSKRRWPFAVRRSFAVVAGSRPFCCVCRFYGVHAVRLSPFGARRLQFAVCSAVAVCSVQCAVCSVQCAVYSVQCAACSVQRAACSVPCAVCRAMCRVLFHRRCSPSLHRWPFAVCRVQCAVCRVPCAVCRLPFALGFFPFS